MATCQFFDDAIYIFEIIVICGRFFFESADGILQACSKNCLAGLTMFKHEDRVPYKSKVAVVKSVLSIVDGSDRHNTVSFQVTMEEAVEITTQSTRTEARMPYFPHKR